MVGAPSPAHGRARKTDWIPPVSAHRRFVRDSRGRFASAPGGSTSSATGRAATTPEAARRAALRRQRARRVATTTAKAGVAVAAVVVASQVRPSSTTRTAPARRRIERAYVARAAADHRKITTLRASAFPTTRLKAPKFDPRAARTEARSLTKGYRGQVRAARRVRR